MDYFLTECRAIFEASGGLILSMFIGGLVGSVTHCTGMCGPIVMAQTSGRDIAHTSKRPGGYLRRITGAALLPYHFGRATTYISLGIIGASASQYLVGTTVHTAVASTLLMLAGALFFLKSAPGLLPANASAKLALAGGPYQNLVGSFAAPFSNMDGKGSLYFFGVMLGFLPCGLVMAAVMATASTGDPKAAAFGMAAFSLGTVPSLVFVSAGTGYLKRRFPKEVDKCAKAVMAANGLLLCFLAMSLGN